MNSFNDPGVDGRILSESYRNRLRRRGQDWSGSGQGGVPGSSERSNETFGLHKMQGLSYLAE